MNGKAYKKGQTYTVNAKMAESLKASGQFSLKLVESKNKEEGSDEDYTSEALRINADLRYRYRLQSRYRTR